MSEREIVSNLTYALEHVSQNMTGYGDASEMATELTNSILHEVDRRVNLAVRDMAAFIIRHQPSEVRHSMANEAFELVKRAELGDEKYDDLMDEARSTRDEGLNLDEAEED